jgi:hypothetical protein
VLPRGQALGAAPSRLAGLNIVLRGCSKVVALAAATLAKRGPAASPPGDLGLRETAPEGPLPCAAPFRALRVEAP